MEREREDLGTKMEMMKEVKMMEKGGRERKIEQRQGRERKRMRVKERREKR